MPNYCSNVLIVKGAPNDLAEFKTKNQGIVGEGRKKEITHLSFQSLVPMPQELDGTQSPPDQETAAQKEAVALLTKKYGANNWYDWRITNWGTKWDIGSSSFLTESDKLLKYEFDTAWSPPLGWLEKVAVFFPSLEFEMRYCEEGNGFYGRTYGQQDDWNQESYEEEEWHEKFDEDFQEQVAFIKKLPYKEFIQKYSDPESSFTEDGDIFHYRFLDKHILARIKDRDLPLFIARQWNGNDYAMRMKGATPSCTKKSSGSPRRTTSTARRKNGRSSTRSRQPAPTASSS